MSASERLTLREAISLDDDFFCNFFNIQRRQLFHLMCILIECHFLGSSPIDSIKSFNFFPFLKFSPKELTIFTRR